MNIEIEYAYKQQVIPGYNEIIERVVLKSLDYENCPYEVQVYVLLTDDNEIWTINKEHRKIDRPTDVLSFPMYAYEKPACFDEVEDDMDAFHPSTGELMLGDIIISMDKVLSQAKAFGHSKERELAFLVAHSMLHLMGYDHMTDEERMIMEAKQEDILKQLHYTRDMQIDDGKTLSDE